MCVTCFGCLLGHGSKPDGIATFGLGGELVSYSLGAVTPGLWVRRPLFDLGGKASHPFSYLTQLCWRYALEEIILSYYLSPSSLLGFIFYAITTVGLE